jgi:hypothetical protein
VTRRKTEVRTAATAYRRFNGVAKRQTSDAMPLLIGERQRGQQPVKAVLALGRVYRHRSAQPVGV